MLLHTQWISVGPNQPQMVLVSASQYSLRGTLNRAFLPLAWENGFISFQSWESPSLWGSKQGVSRSGPTQQWCYLHSCQVVLCSCKIPCPLPPNPIPLTFRTTAKNTFFLAVTFTMCDSFLFFFRVLFICNSKDECNLKLMVFWNQWMQFEIATMASYRVCLSYHVFETC